MNAKSTCYLCSIRQQNMNEESDTLDLTYITADYKCQVYKLRSKPQRILDINYSEL